jgi:hypothetical protein
LVEKSKKEKHTVSMGGARTGYVHMVGSLQGFYEVGNGRILFKRIFKKGVNLCGWNY